MLCMYVHKIAAYVSSRGAREFSFFQLRYWILAEVFEMIMKYVYYVLLLYVFPSSFQNEHVRIIYQCTWPRCGIKMDICSDMERHVRSKHLM